MFFMGTGRNHEHFDDVIRVGLLGRSLQSTSFLRQDGKVKDISLCGN